MSKQEKYWSDYWQNDGQEGEVFVNSKGEKPDYILDFWRSQLNDVDDYSSIVDLACGAGSIFEDFGDATRSKVKLIAVDISQAALDIVKKRVPEAETICCGCEDLPFASSSVELFVSQFGIEYAGIEAFSEATNKLAKGGRLAFLCHYKNGYIDKRNAAFLEGAKLAISSNFIEAATLLIKASYSGSMSQIEQAKEQFNQAQIPLANSFKDNPEGIHHHLYFGFRQLYLKRSSYLQSDIDTWLQQMKADIEKNIVKVSEIRKVSLDESDLKKIEKNLKEIGVRSIDFEKLFIPGTEDIVAWTISVKK